MIGKSYCCNNGHLIKKYHSLDFGPIPAVATRMARALLKPAKPLQEEMGFVTDLKETISFIYQSPFDNGLTEHELDHILVEPSTVPQIQIQMRLRPTNGCPWNPWRRPCAKPRKVYRMVQDYFFEKFYEDLSQWVWLFIAKHISMRHTGLFERIGATRKTKKFWKVQQPQLSWA